MSFNNKLENHILALSSENQILETDQDLDKEVPVRLNEKYDQNKQNLFEK